MKWKKQLRRSLRQGKTEQTIWIDTNLSVDTREKLLILLKDQQHYACKMSNIPELTRGNCS